MKNHDFKEQLKNKLINENQSAAYVQRVKAMVVMEYGDKTPSHLPFTNALRILKYKALKDKQVNSDPVIALSILKGTSPYNNIIKDISYDKLYIIGPPQKLTLIVFTQKTQTSQEYQSMLREV